MPGIRRPLLRMIRLILLYASSNGLSRALVFLAIPLLQNFVSTAALGVYTLTQTVSQLIVPLIALNTGVALTREAHERPHTTRVLLDRISAAGAVIGCIGGAGMFLSSAWIPLALAIGAAEAVQSSSVAVFQGLERAGYVFSAAIIRNLMFVATVFVAYRFELDVHALLMGQAAAYMLCAAVSYALARNLLTRAHAPAIAGDEITPKSMLLYSITTLPHTAALWLAVSSDRLILGAIAGRDILGQYAMAFTFGQIALLITSGVAMALPPRIARQPEVWTNRSFLRKFALAVGASCLVAHLIAVGIIALDHGTIRYFKQLPPDSPYIVAVISTAAFSSILYVIYASFLFLHRETKQLPKASLLAGSSGLAATALLVLTFGKPGAAFGLLSSYLSFGFFYARTAARVHPESRGTLRALLVGIATYLAFALLISHGCAAYLRATP